MGKPSNVTVKLSDIDKRRQTSESLIRRFNKLVKKEKIIEDYLDKTSYFKSKPTKRKEKSKRAKIRAAREARKALRKKRR